MSVNWLTVQAKLVLGDFEFEIAEEFEMAGITAIFGPSGSGKSTLLRTIAGFATPQSGRITCGPDSWFDSVENINVAPHERPVGFMFQDTRLFDHLDVSGNLAFAERRRQKQERRIRRQDVFAALDLEPLLHRRVQSLSGGERQRVALGRTLLSGPRLLLLDEPLAALDRERKAEIIPYLENLPRRIGIPTFYVSHDVDEIAQLAERALVLVAGRTQLHGTITDAVESLDLLTMDGRFNAGVLVEGRIVRHDPRLRATHVDLGGDPLIIHLVEHLSVGQPIRLRVRSRDVAIATQRPEGLSIRNIIPGRLVAIVDDLRAGGVDCTVETRGARIRARLTPSAVEDLGLAEGMQVYALIKSVSFDRLL